MWTRERRADWKVLMTRAVRSLCVSVAVGSIAVVTGCATLTGGARLRAAADFSCPASEVTATAIGAGGVRASGCGQVATYVCIEDRAGRVTCERESEIASLAPPRSDESVMRALAIARPALDACLPPGETRIRFTLDPSGAVTHAWPSDPAGRTASACVTGAFHGVRVDERAAEARTATVRLSPRRGATTVIAGAEDPQIEAGPSTSPASATDARDAEGSLRAALSRRRSAILACVGTDSVALSIAYTALGDLSIGLRGALAGSDEEECVRAALSDVRMEPAPGTAGSLIHAVTAD
jgi:hypothetical protein